MKRMALRLQVKHIKINMEHSAHTPYSRLPEDPVTSAWSTWPTRRTEDHKRRIYKEAKAKCRRCFLGENGHPNAKGALSQDFLSFFYFMNQSHLGPGYTG